MKVISIRTKLDGTPLYLERTETKIIVELTNKDKFFIEEGTDGKLLITPYDGKDTKE